MTGPFFALTIASFVTVAASAGTATATDPPVTDLRAAEIESNEAAPRTNSMDVHPYCTGRTHNPHRSPNTGRVRVHGETSCTGTYNPSGDVYVRTSICKVWRSSSGNSETCSAQGWGEDWDTLKAYSTADATECANGEWRGTSYHEVYDFGRVYTGSSSKTAIVSNC